MIGCCAAMHAEDAASLLQSQMFGLSQRNIFVQPSPGKQPWAKTCRSASQKCSSKQPQMRTLLSEPPAHLTACQRQTRWLGRGRWLRAAPLQLRPRPLFSIRSHAWTAEMHGCVACSCKAEHFGQKPKHGSAGIWQSSHALLLMLEAHARGLSSRCQPGQTVHPPFSGVRPLSAAAAA